MDEQISKSLLASIRKSQSALWNPYIYIYSALTRSCFGRGVDHSSTHSASQSGHFRTGPILRVHSHSASQSGHFRPRSNSEIDESLQSFCQSKWPFLDAVHFRALRGEDRDVAPPRRPFFASRGAISFNHTNRLCE